MAAFGRYKQELRTNATGRLQATGRRKEVPECGQRPAWQHHDAAAKPRGTLVPGNFAHPNLPSRSGLALYIEDLSLSSRILTVEE